MALRPNNVSGPLDYVSYESIHNISFYFQASIIIIIACHHLHTNYDHVTGPLDVTDKSVASWVSVASLHQKYRAVICFIWIHSYNFILSPIFNNHHNCMIFTHKLWHWDQIMFQALWSMFHMNPFIQFYFVS